jgi:SAM-dependent methyltransferase
MKNQDFDNEYFAHREKDLLNRLKMHALDRKWVRKLIGEYGGKPILLDIGCSDGSFAADFSRDGFRIFGIEPNVFQANLASQKGIQIVDTFEEIPHLDVVIIRGTLHHLPNYRIVLESVFTLFEKSPGQSDKWIFILAEPNSESQTFRRFQKLPAIEQSQNFQSNYKIFGARELKEYFQLKGEVHLDYPYLRTPYRKLWRDSLQTISSNYLGTPWFRNQFNLGVRISRYR